MSNSRDAAVKLFDVAYGELEAILHEMKDLVHNPSNWVAGSDLTPNKLNAVKNLDEATDTLIKHFEMII